MREIRVFDSKDKLIRAAADLFRKIATRAIDERRRFVVALSGGSTPEPIYQFIAKNFRHSIDWSSVFFFIGDERNVPADSNESNFRMANQALFVPLGISSDQIHPWPTDLQEPEKIAAAYAKKIESILGDAPRFDLILLGLGNDCHTASLFPNTPALKETASVAVSNWVEKLQAHRLTMTFPVINNSANVIFAVSGNDKADAVADVLEGDFRPDDLPAQFVNPTEGDVIWLLDEAAASKLSQRNWEGARD